MPTSAINIANSPEITVKQLHSAGPMCTGKRQTHIRNAPSSRTAVTGIGPYAHSDGLTEKQKTLASLTVSPGKIFRFSPAFFCKPVAQKKVPVYNKIGK